MTTHTLNAGERRLVWWPFWGLPANAAPDIRIGAGPWLKLTEDPGFVPDEPPARPGAKWFRALLAHPDAPPRDGAITVPLGTSTLRHRVVGDPEIEIPNPGEYVAAAST
ncbi:hypothetical protein FDO65_10230 [Nakamurella flava]|uniref:Uncharacterized protein n=1 Tax=Nakamurella flava TaxID=2576308 RepID=A0A4U6QP97_9ACTN|nr:hypothetical protein [Nakamurella flava]TKV61892.1 hypothetical protein FDO65_10230 [Nakamurella flava]